MTRIERWGAIVAGGVLLATGLARRSSFGIGMAGVGFVLLRFATRRLKERTEGTISGSSLEAPGHALARTEVAAVTQPRHAS
jgi:hypothetical protein